MAYATVTVRVMDVNDNRPQLQLPALLFTVPENISEPVYITTAVANDDDTGNNADIQFSFTVTSDNFSINGSTGEVTTLRELDREEMDVHQLTIQATDGMFSEEGTITVTVADVNDNPPVFGRDSYSVAVLENRPRGTSVLTVEATDEDLGENATISFSIAEGDERLFTVDCKSVLQRITHRLVLPSAETGLVRTLVELDFESNPWHSLIVRASDGGASSLSSFAVINITVMDLNDHIPTFLNPLPSIEISERVDIGEILTDLMYLIVTAVILVKMESDLPLLQVQDTDLFSVDNVTGVLKTEALLDRDEGPECHFLTIQATDSAGDSSLSSVTEIQVCLMDVNDNCPKFIQPSFSGQIPENQVTGQQLLLRVRATDGDSGTNGAIEYGLLRDGVVFDIDPTTGFLSLTSSLDTETTPSYDLVVEACDRGAGPCCTNTTITVNVIDVNDNRPVITNINTDSCIDVVELSGNVQEIGDVVFAVNATDRDSGLNGAILFEIVGSSPFFDISSSGVITIAGQLDYETQNTHQLYINALDQGQPLSLTSETRILCINVVDINDKIPSFPVTQYNMTQNEGTLPEAAIVNVFARDDDSGDNAAVFYSITNGNTSVFRINEETGQMFLLEELDCETTTSFSLTITANNSLSTCPLSSTVQVLVLVGDVNDNPPVLSQNMYNTTIPENVALSEEILRIYATDADKTAPNNELQYRLLLGAGSNPFHLDDQGRLTVQNALDAEGLFGLQYSFSVEVRDSGEVVMRDSANVVIFVEDANDEAPFFSQNTFSVSVSESEDTPFPLLPLFFFDDDVEPSNRESFITIDSVTGYHTPTNNFVTLRGSDAFSVNENNTLELRRSLDRENISSYGVTVAVTNTADCYEQDGGQCSSFAVIEVAVIDVNDKLS
ncbi:Protocadherin Fat 4 [Geodia barretti]|uniref:Protocadherin Fat 4 n=1 Tax=Geodia barretti TaxID=519541 RepID=A0AA35W719_GEOBA|nr:Protocadherin Fat 4 [Geodia barretti]